MDLKRHMQVLLEEKKQIEEPIERDLRKYAELSTDIEAKKKAYHDKKKCLQDMEKFFSYFVDENVFSEDSIHISAVKQELKEIDNQLAMLQNEISKKQNYYEALSKSDYKALSKIGTEESCIAAIERFYSTAEKANVSARMELTRNIEECLPEGDFGEKIVGYLVLNHLIYCEQHGYKAPGISSERSQYDKLMKKHAPKNSNKLWESMEPVYQSYEIEKLLDQCVDAMAECKEQAYGGVSLEESFDKTCELIEQQMRSLLPKVKGIKMTLKAQKVRRWYRASFVKVDRLLQQWQSQNKTEKKEYERLMSIEKRLRKGMEEGLSQKECTEIKKALQAEKTYVYDSFKRFVQENNSGNEIEAQIMHRFMENKETYVSVSTIKKAILEMSKEFDKQVADITLEKNRLLQSKDKR